MEELAELVEFSAKRSAVVQLGRIRSDLDVRAGPRAAEYKGHWPRPIRGVVRPEKIEITPTTHLRGLAFGRSALYVRLAGNSSWCEEK